MLQRRAQALLFLWDDGVKKMLSIKTLRVAIVAMGSALLLGPGLAAAQGTFQNLEDEVEALTYAAESLGAGVNNVEDADGNATHYGLKSPDIHSGAHYISVETTRRVERSEGLFVILEFGGGLVFNSNIVDNVAIDIGDDDDARDSVLAFNNPGNRVGAANHFGGGRAGDSFVTFKLQNQGVAPGESIWFTVFNQLAVPAGEGSYTASITSRGGNDDALGPAFSGSATVLNVVSGLDAGVAMGAPATADVATGFKNFVDGANQAALGSLWARAKEGDAAVLAAADGETAESGDILAAGADALGVTIKGDLSVGTFQLVSATSTVADGTFVAGQVDCGTATAADALAMEMEEVAEGEGPVTDTSMGTASRMVGEYGLCVDVTENEDRIPAGAYTASLSTTAVGEGAMAMEVVTDAAIGSIEQNGTSVNIAYLTASDKYNQRLVIVNRSAREVEYNVTNFVTEDGTTVEGTEATSGTIEPMSQAVLRVADLLTFTGMTRAAATVDVDALTGEVSVATTQVNLADGSTDTVLYN